MGLYRPKLRYCFCVANYRSLWPQLSLMQYLNDQGIAPYILVQACGMIDRYAQILKNMNLQFVKSPYDLPADYDVMFSQSTGLDEYEIASLSRSWKAGKTNIKLHNSMSTYDKITNVNYIPDRVKGRLHGFCMKENRAVVHYKRFLSEHLVWFLNVGDPDWDYFQTEDFKTAVSDTKTKYGNKLLLICASFDAGSAEGSFWLTVVPWAVNQGFQIMIRPHPGCEHRIPSAIKKFAAPDIHRHVLFASASHVIAEMASSVVGECMMLKTKVGSYPFVPHHPKYGVHSWIDSNTLWKEAIVRQVGAPMLSYVPLVHTKGSLESFLSSDTPIVSQEQMNALWGWPIVPCYSEYLFNQVETKLGVQ